MHPCGHELRGGVSSFTVACVQGRGRKARGISQDAQCRGITFGGVQLGPPHGTERTVPLDQGRS